ncbi:MAG: hypothetical protein IKP08_05520 [Bacteroidales bacterium]|nr:hypothetical protein [Bacteroidales bacterium]
MEPKTKKYLIIGGIVILLAIIGNLSREEEKKSRTPQDESVFMKEERPSMVDSRNQLSQNCDSLRGIKPEQSRNDGSVQVVKDYIEENAKYPRSIRYKEWSKVTDYGDMWVVRCKFKGKNSFGEIADNDMWFYIQNGKVVKMSAAR